MRISWPSAPLTSGRGRGRDRTASTADLSEWNDRLFAHLDPVEHADLLDRLPRD